MRISPHVRRSGEMRAEAARAVPPEHSDPSDGQL